MSNRARAKRERQDIFFPFYRLRRIFICLYGDSMRKGKEKEVTEQEKITDTVRGREAKNKEN